MSSWWQLDPLAPDPRALREAVATLRRGGLVVFPTETVYGVGADGLNPAAVRRLLAVKRRPPGRPLPLLIGEAAMVYELAAQVPPSAEALMEAFWPGPLTLILWRNERVPAETVAGGPTVGLRFPDHPVALALARQAGGPLAAPSANRSGQPPPRTAAAAQSQLGEEVEVYLDAGPAALGTASTVVDLTVEPARLRRAGRVTQADLERVLGAGRVVGGTG
jgi:L-threonylcarbamoyladenylate synthase